eukprot:gene16382-biopygen6736
MGQAAEGAVRGTAFHLFRLAFLRLATFDLSHSPSCIYYFPDSRRHPLPACAACSPKQQGNGPHRAAPAVRLAFSVLRSGACVLRSGTCALRSDPAFCVQLRSRSPAFCVQGSASACVLPT